MDLLTWETGVRDGVRTGGRFCIGFQNMLSNPPNDTIIWRFINMKYF